MMKRSSTKHALIAGIAFIITCVIALTARQLNGSVSMAQEIISIPVILNYAGDSWIDQNGNTMEEDVAEKFLRNNPEYALEILYLNGNQCYATGLQNEARSEIIKELHKKYFALTRKHYDSNRNAVTYVTALQELMATPPTSDAFNKLIVHLRNNRVLEDVKYLQVTCRKLHGEIEIEYVSEAASYLFFWSLAENYDSGSLDSICGAPIMEVSSPQIPVILSGDNKTWLDQNGENMDGERARFFLITNKEYTREILYLNGNPYYLDTWQSDERDAAIEQLEKDLRLDSWETNSFAADYSWAVHDILDNPPSLEVLAEYQSKLGYNGAIYRISDLVGYIEGNKGLSSSNTFPNYLFWSAVAKATENGVLKSIGE